MGSHSFVLRRGARTDHVATLIRINVWTANLGLHAYYEGQGFRRCAGRDHEVSVKYPLRRCSSGR